MKRKSVGALFMILSYFIPFMFIPGVIMLFSPPLALPGVVYFFAHIILLSSIFLRSIFGLIVAAIFFMIAHILYYVAFRNQENETGNDNFGTAALFMVVAAPLFLLFGVGAIVAIIGWVFAMVAFEALPDE